MREGERWERDDRDIYIYERERGGESAIERLRERAR